MKASLQPLLHFDFVVYRVSRARFYDEFYWFLRCYAEGDMTCVTPTGNLTHGDTPEYPILLNVIRE